MQLGRRTTRFASARPLKAWGDVTSWTSWRLLYRRVVDLSASQTQNNESMASKSSKKSREGSAQGIELHRNWLASRNSPCGVKNIVVERAKRPHLFFKSLSLAHPARSIPARPCLSCLGLSSLCMHCFLFSAVQVTIPATFPEKLSAYLQNPVHKEDDALKSLNTLKMQVRTYT